jgi:hypothetical protein
LSKIGVSIYSLLLIQVCLFSSLIAWKKFALFVCLQMYESSGYATWWLMELDNWIPIVLTTSQ